MDLIPSKNQPTQKADSIKKICFLLSYKRALYINICLLYMKIINSIIFQGSGWGWLGYNKVAKKLEIAACKDQDLLEATTGPL